MLSVYNDEDHDVDALEGLAAAAGRFRQVTAGDTLQQLPTSRRATEPWLHERRGQNLVRGHHEGSAAKSPTDTMGQWMKEGRCTVISLITSLRLGEPVAEFHRITNPGLKKPKVSDQHGGTFYSRHHLSKCKMGEHGQTQTPARRDSI